MIYRDIFAGPARNYSRDRDGDPTVTRKLWITIHCTANTASAEGEASYARRRDDDVSSHYYADDRNLLQALDTDWRAWHAGSAQGNDYGISYEITGLPTWSRTTWLRNVAWGKLAAQIRRDMAAHDIPIRDLTPSDLKARRPGITTHNELRLAFGGTDHTCPGPSFPTDHLIQLLREEDDMPSNHEIWNEDGIIKAPPGYEDSDNTHWSAAAFLQSIQVYARRGYERDGKILARQDAILAAVAGQDVAKAAAQAADKAAREATRKAFEAGQAALLAAIREEWSGSVTDDQIERVFRRVLGSLDDQAAV